MKYGLPHPKFPAGSFNIVTSQLFSTLRKFEEQITKKPRYLAPVITNLHAVQAS